MTPCPARTHRVSCGPPLRRRPARAHEVPDHAVPVAAHRWRGTAERIVCCGRDEALRQRELRCEGRQGARYRRESQVASLCDGLLEQTVRLDIGECRPRDAATQPLAIARPDRVRTIEQLAEWQCMPARAQMVRTTRPPREQTDFRYGIRDVIGCYEIHWRVFGAGYQRGESGVHHAQC